MWMLNDEQTESWTSALCHAEAGTTKRVIMSVRALEWPDIGVEYSVFCMFFHSCICWYQLKQSGSLLITELVFGVHIALTLNKVANVRQDHLFFLNFSPPFLKL